MRRTAFMACTTILLLGTSHALYFVDYIDANRWWMTLANNGTFAVPLVPDWDCSWRLRSHIYLFGGGPWLGIIDNGDMLVTMAYNPNAPTVFETSPGDSLGGEYDSLVIVYVYPRSWPAPSTRFPDAPRSRRADQDGWFSFNDLLLSQHYPPGRPIGVQFSQSTYVWDDALAQDFVYHRYTMENQSGDTLRGLYFGIVLDPDIGDVSDDMYGAFHHRRFSLAGDDSLYVDNLVYAYDADNSEPGWDTVGVVGASLIKSPGAAKVSALKRWTLEQDPLYDPEQFLALSGYDWTSHEYSPIDTIDTVPGDKRMLVAVGPFDLLPGMQDSAVLAVLGVAEWPDTIALVKALHTADSIYRNRPAGVGSPPERRITEVCTGTSIVHGVLCLPEQGSVAVLLDAVGRRVIDLRPGANDVRALAPGVYFVRQASSVRRQASSVTKVILTK